MSTPTTIESFHAEIVQWQSEGASLRLIAKRLQKRGLDVDHNGVRRYCVKVDIPLNPPPKKATTRRVSSGSPKIEPNLFLPPAPDPPPAAAKSRRSKARKKSARTPANTPYLQGVRATKRGVPPARKPKAAPVPRQRSEGDLTAKPPPEFISSSKLKTMSFTQTPLSGPPKPPVAPVQIPAPQVAAPPTAPAQSLQLPTSPRQTLKPVPPPVPWRDPPRLFTPLPKEPLWNNDLELLKFGDSGDQWTLRDACEGTFILGASGSGKTTGSGRTLADAFLAYHFGGLILTVKPGEVHLWERYARAAGREAQLCIVRPGGKFKLNFLDYESRRPGKGSGMVENLVSLFYTIIDVTAKGQNNRELSRFWTDAGKELVRNTFRVLTLATSPLKLEDVCRFIIESPHRVYGGSPKQAGPWFTECMNRADAVARGTPQEAVIEKAKLHWLDTFFNLSPDTRSCVVTAFSAMADVFVEPAIHDLFCTETTIIPENILEGAIVIVDLPLLSGYETVGLFAQSIWKYLFQKAIERRDDPEDDSRRPAFLWIDEAQHFHSANDALFQATARSARCATVYLTQTISGFHGNSPSPQSVDGFLGNLNTKILHCNNDHASNVWAANQIGQYKTQVFSSNISHQPKQGGGGWFDSFFRSDKNVSSGMSEQIQYAVEPSAFLNMRTGGKRFDFLVDAYFVKGGAKFSTGRHYFPTVFQQEF